MTRMGREFSLVLLGAGILTSGYFLAPSPEQELEKKAEQLAADRVGGNVANNGNNGNGHVSHFGYHPILFVHSASYAGSSTGRPAAATGGVARGGFGGMGHAAASASA